jgi:2,5-diamino-6-(ribosylamino)-4(3H)-pyrimidinone 5'-phosphate reductase
VLLNFASTLDGKINPAPGKRAGTFMMSRHREDPRRMRVLRAEADAVLIGAANLRADDPDLALSADERSSRRAAGKPEPLRIVVTTAGEGLSPTMKMFDPKRGGPAIVVHTKRMPADRRRALAAAAELVQLGDDGVGMPELLAWLYERGVRTLLCEGGGQLVAQLFADRAVDELYLTIVPRILGGNDAPTLAGGPGFAANDIPDAKLASLEQFGDELFLRYDFAWV